MEHLKIPVTAATAVFLALVGTICVFQPKRMQEWIQKQYHGSNRSIRRYTFSNLIFKTWYPTYLRVMGVWAWLLALVFAYGVYVSVTGQ
jgi:hypothetical protein